MTLSTRLAALEQQLLDQEHHACLGLGRLDGRYLDRQLRRRDLTLQLLRDYQRQIAALRVEVERLRAEQGDAAGVVLTAQGFEKNPD